MEVLRALIFSFLQCFMLLAAASAWAAPDQNWTVQDTATDCSGSGQQGTANCQDYSTDLYENIDYSASGDLSSDIQTLRTGYDKKYFYFEVDFAGDWSEASSTGHSIVIEFDVDSDVEIGRADYYIGIYQKSEFNNGTWQDAYETGGYESYEDANDDVGGPQTLLADFGGSSGDGYEKDVKQRKDRVWARIINGNFQLAVSTKVLGDPELAFMRVWSRQSSSLPKDKLYFHDQNASSDVSQIDNLCGLPIHLNCAGVGPALEPLLTVIKSSNTSVAAPGDTITYTVQVSNIIDGGDAQSIVVIDDLSPYSILYLDAYGIDIPFQFLPESSGLTMGTPVYSDDDGTTFLYVPSGPLDSKVTDVRIPMTGVMSSGNYFILNYQVQVK